MLDSATIYQVAETADVSVRTVSRYLNDPSCVSAKTSARIVEAMQALQFRPSKAARALKGVTPNLIGVVSDRITTSPDSFELIKGLQLAAKDLGKRLLIAECGGIEEDVPALIDELIEHRVDALIFATHFHRPVDTVRLDRAMGTRLVLLNCYRDDGSHPTVVPDDEQGARDGPGGPAGAGAPPHRGLRAVPADARHPAAPPRLPAGGPRRRAAAAGLRAGFPGRHRRRRVRRHRRAGGRRAGSAPADRHHGGQRQDGRPHHPVPAQAAGGRARRGVGARLRRPPDAGARHRPAADQRAPALPADGAPRCPGGLRCRDPGHAEGMLRRAVARASVAPVPA